MTFEPVIDFEPEVDEVDLEFKVMAMRLQAKRRRMPWASDSIPTKRIEDLLNSGWQLDNQVVCRPFVMLIFSREKEREEENNA